MSAVQEIVEKFEKDLGSEMYVSPTRLVEIGVFASYSGVMRAIHKETIPCLKISPHRCLIPTKAIVEYLYDRATA